VIQISTLRVSTAINSTQPNRDLTVILGFEAHFEKIKTCRESALPQGCPFVRGNWREQSIKHVPATSQYRPLSFRFRFIDHTHRNVINELAGRNAHHPSVAQG